MRIFTGYRKSAAFFVASFLGLPGFVLAQGSDAAPESPVVLAPSSAWALEYSDDSCRVARSFGEGEQLTVLHMTQFEPDHSFMLAVAGGGLDRNIRADRAQIQFGPVHERLTEKEPHPGTIGKFAPGLIFADISVRQTELPKPSSRRKDQARIANFVPVDPITPEDEAKVEWIEIAVRDQPHVRLATGPMGDLFTSLNTCSEELLTHWGLDLERHRTISRKVVPKQSPAQWISTNDYPSEAWRRGEQAIVYFRLMVDESGRPYSCYIQQSGYSAGFDEAVCNSMMRRARFEPALDGEGKPIKSYFRTAVRFDIPH